MMKRLIRKLLNFFINNKNIVRLTKKNMKNLEKVTRETLAKNQLLVFIENNVSKELIKVTDIVDDKITYTIFELVEKDVFKKTEETDTEFIDTFLETNWKYISNRQKNIKVN